MRIGTIDRVRRFDAARPGLPGEHGLVFACGLALLVLAVRSGSRGATVAAALAGAGLVARAASGRDGPVARLGRARREGPPDRDPVVDPPYL